MSSIEQLHPILPTMPPTLTKSEILCNSQEQDKFLPDEGIDSSATMELKPGRTVNSCKRYFIAPESSGLFIRLVRNENQSIDPARRNLTEFCPLSIVSMKSIESMMTTLTLKSHAIHTSLESLSERNAARLCFHFLCLTFRLLLSLMGIHTTQWIVGASIVRIKWRLFCDIEF